MVFNLISFSIRFAPPRVALAFEQRHVRFVKIPITYLVVIMLYYILYRENVERVVIIIIVPVRRHVYRSNVLMYYVLLDPSIDDYCTGRHDRGQYRLCLCCSCRVGGRVKT